MKKIISIFMSVIIAITALFPISAFASSINTAQTALTVGVGTVAQTFKYGYPTGNYGSYVSENSIYYRFVAPTTDYYEFSATGYENTVYTPGNQANVYIDISDSMGKYVGSASTNEVTYVTKKAIMLNAGQTYTIELYTSMSSILSYDSSDYGYAEQTLYFTIAPHTHEFTTSIYNYSDGAYNTSYDCNFCDYYTSIYTPAPNSNENSTVSTYNSNGFVSSKKPSKTKIVKLTAKKKALTVKWVKPSYASGYQIQIATDKGFKKNKKTITVSKSSATSKTISKLKAKKKYYVRVRTYVVSNGKKTYSSWSSVKSVKTK